jgi:GNAT superfamily N-acetyltransferase
MIIESFRPEHQAAVAELVLGIQQNEFNVPVTLEDQPDLMDVARAFLVRAGGFWVAMHDARVVGTIGLMDIGDGLFVIRKMFVARDHRGTADGPAAALLGCAFARARASDGRAIYLGTHNRLRAACRFYEKNGFVQVDEAALPAVFPRMKVDDRFYRFDLALQSP